MQIKKETGWGPLLYMSAEEVLICLWGSRGGLKGVGEHWTGWGYMKKTEHVCRAGDWRSQDNQELPTSHKEEISPEADQEAPWHSLTPTGGPCSITEATLGLCAVPQGTSITAHPNGRPGQKVSFTGICTWRQQGVLFYYLCTHRDLILNPAVVMWSIFCCVI